MLPSLVVADGNDSLSNFSSLLSSLDCIGTSQLTSNKTNDSLSSFKREALQPLSNNSIISEKCAWSIWSQNWNWFYHYQLLSARPGNEPFIDFSCFQNSTFYSHTKHPLTDSLWNNMQYREKRNKHLTRFVLLTIKAGVDLLFWFKNLQTFFERGNFGIMSLWGNSCIWVLIGLDRSLFESSCLQCCFCLVIDILLSTTSLTNSTWSCDFWLHSCTFMSCLFCLSETRLTTGWLDSDKLKCIISAQSGCNVSHRSKSFSDRCCELNATWDFVSQTCKHVLGLDFTTQNQWIDRQCFKCNIRIRSQWLDIFWNSLIILHSRTQLSSDFC